MALIWSIVLIDYIVDMNITGVVYQINCEEKMPNPTLDRSSSERLKSSLRSFQPSRDSYISIESDSLDDILPNMKHNLNVDRSELSGNVIYASRKFHTNGSHINIKFSGKNNILFLGERCSLYGDIIFNGDNSAVFIDGPQNHLTASINIYESGTFFWGSRSSAYGVRAWVHGGGSCIIGEDCLFSEQVQMRTSDHHAIIDTKSRKIISRAKDIELGNHIWIGEGVSILKGTTIGDGSIVGARSVVVGRIGSAELWAGTPARRLRRSTTWTDMWAPTPDQINTVIQSATLTKSQETTVLERAVLKLRRLGSRDPN